MSISEIAPENDPMAAQETKENDAPKSLEDVIKERALKRKEKWAQNHRQAEEHCKNVPLPFFNFLHNLTFFC